MKKEKQKFRKEEKHMKSKILKKLTSVVLAGAMLLTGTVTAPVTAKAADGVSLTEGNIYEYAGCDWMVAEINGNCATMVMTKGNVDEYGEMADGWPGYHMSGTLTNAAGDSIDVGNADTNYNGDIDGYDTHEYNEATKRLYSVIKDDEYTSASYGKGLYLLPKSCVENQSGLYWEALKTAAKNLSLFGADDLRAWLGTVNGSSYVYYVHSDGNVFSLDQNDSYVVAPAFNLDTSKVYPSEIKYVGDLATEFTVTYKDYDGKTITTTTATYGNDFQHCDNPTRSGYAFKYWLSGEGKVVYPNSFPTATRDETYTAVYEEAETRNGITEGHIYKYAGAEWTAVNVHENYTEMILTKGNMDEYGEMADGWPGYHMSGTLTNAAGDSIDVGNADTNYNGDIDGYDTHEYNEATKRLYSVIKDDEYTSASYSKGLYLLPKSYVENENGLYYEALKTAIKNNSSFGASLSCSWLGTVYDSSSAWYVSSVGHVYNNSFQNYSCVVAPAFNLDTSKVSADEIIDLTAERTVTFKDYDGNTISTKSDYHYGWYLEVPSNPTRTGYTFKGWSTDGSTVIELPATVTADATYTAVYEADTTTVTGCAVTFKDYDGNIISTKSDYHYGDTLVVPSSPTRTGYTFKGWSTDGTNVITLPGKVTADATYKAVYEKNADKPSNGGGNGGGSASGGSGGGGGYVPVPTPTPNPDEDKKDDNVVKHPDGSTTTTDKTTDKDKNVITTVTDKDKDGNTTQTTIITEFNKDNVIDDKDCVTWTEVTEYETVKTKETITYTFKDGSSKTDIYDYTTGADVAVSIFKDKDGKVTTSATITTLVSGKIAKNSVNLVLSKKMVLKVFELVGRNTKKVPVTIIGIDSEGYPVVTIGTYLNNLKEGKILGMLQPAYSTTILVPAKVSEIGAGGAVIFSKMNPYELYKAVSNTTYDKRMKAISKSAKLKKTSATIKKGKTTKVQMSKSFVKDNVKKITYSTSNKKVATVSKAGTVKGKKAGTVKVKAKLYFQNGKTKTLTMKVKVK